TGSMLNEANRLRFNAEEFYYKSAGEMYELFKNCPAAVRHTLEIADRCNIDLRFDQMLLPHYEVPSGQTPDSYLEALCVEGLARRYGSPESRVHGRLQYEL